MTLFENLKKTSVSLFACMLLLPSLNASAASLEGIPSGMYNVDITHASVVWKVSHFGFSNYVGRFNDFSADINLNSEDFTKSTVNVDIKVDSIDTAYPKPEEEDFDKELAEGWFKSTEHPSIQFKSTSVSALDGDNFKINGDLTLMGKTHPVTLDATLNGATAAHPFKKVPLIGFSAKTTIDRTVWGLSKYAPKVGASVSVEIESEFLNTAK